MIIDANNVFMNAQELSDTSAAEVSTDLVDFEAANPNLGGGTPIWLHCRVNVAHAGPAGQLVAVQLESSDSASGTYTDDLVSRTWSVLEMTAGTELLTTPIPLKHLRYMRVAFTKTGAGFSAGSIDAFLTSGAPRS